MANDVSSNPWVLDTAGAAESPGRQIRILKMVFYANAAENDLVVSHGSGKPIWKVRASVAHGGTWNDYAGVVFDFPEPFIVNDLTITTMDDAGSGSELWVWSV